MRRVRPNLRNALVLTTIILIGVTYRFEFLFQPIRYDEAYTFLIFARQPLLVGLTDFSVFNNHFLHTLLVHFSWQFFGSGEVWAIRFPAVAAGIVLIPASYLAAKRHYASGALIAAAFVSGSSALVEYSVNGRGYTLQALFVTLLIAVAPTVRCAATPRQWLPFVALSVLAVNVVPTSALAVIGIVAWLFLHTRFRRLLVFAVLYSGLLSVLLYLPAFLRTGMPAAYPGYDTTTVLVNLASHWTRDIPPLIWVTALAGLLYVLWQRLRFPPRRWPILLPLLATAAGMFVVGRAGFERNWLYLLPAVLMTASAGIVTLFRMSGQAEGLIAISLCAVLALAGVASEAIYYSPQTGTFQDAEHVVAFLKGLGAPTLRVVSAEPARYPLIYYAESFGLVLERSSANIFAVMQEGETWAEVALAQPDLDLAAYCDPMPMQSFRLSTLYALTPIASGCQVSAFSQ